jgi:hypothetical protein
VETTAVSNLDDFQALNPFFRIIEEGAAPHATRVLIATVGASASTIYATPSPAT